MKKPATPWELKSDFWSNVEIGEPDECWNWTLSTATAGYGQWNRKGYMWRAHRLAYIFSNGEIPERPDLYHGLVIMHTCDNRSCCNPNHLVLGTQAENLEDMQRKDRKRCTPLKGDNNPSAKLNQIMLEKLIDGFMSGMNMADAAAMAGINKTTAYSIIGGNHYLADQARKLIGEKSQAATIQELVEALHDAINRPMGVVPESAAKYYDWQICDALKKGGEQ